VPTAANSAILVPYFPLHCVEMRERERERERERKGERKGC
jgi:hypothetical protein